MKRKWRKGQKRRSSKRRLLGGGGTQLEERRRKAKIGRKRRSLGWRRNHIEAKEEGEKNKKQKSVK